MRHRGILKNYHMGRGCGCDEVDEDRGQIRMIRFTSVQRANGHRNHRRTADSV
jgi:hypothetical protein